MNPLALLNPLLELGKGYLNQRHEKQMQKRQLQGAIANQKLEYVKMGRIAEVEWNNTQAAKRSWTRDYMTLVLSMPLILAFFPNMVPHIEAGFEALDGMPDYYKAAVGVMIGATFAYQKYADWQMSKVYTMPSALETIKALDKQ